MLVYVLTEEFKGAGLRLADRGNGDFAVTIKGRVAGQIRKLDSGDTWQWNFIGPNWGEARVMTAGTCETLPDAMGQFRVFFDRWLAWAEKREGAVLWNEGP
jgi:hypothetical protein